MDLPMLSQAAFFAGHLVYIPLVIAVGALLGRLSRRLLEIGLPPPAWTPGRAPTPNDALTLAELTGKRGVVAKTVLSALLLARRVKVEGTALVRATPAPGELPPTLARALAAMPNDQLVTEAEGRIAASLAADRQRIEAELIADGMRFPPIRAAFGHWHLILVVIALLAPAVVRALHRPPGDPGMLEILSYIALVFIAIAAVYYLEPRPQTAAAVAYLAWLRREQRPLYQRLLSHPEDLAAPEIFLGLGIFGPEAAGKEWLRASMAQIEIDDLVAESRRGD